MKEQDIPYKQLEILGIDVKALTQEDISRLINGQKTDLHDFTIDYTKEREDFLKKEDIKYDIIENNGVKKLKFEGRVAIEEQYYAQNTPENIELLNKSNIQYDKMPKNEHLLKIRDILVAGLILDNPLIGTALTIGYLAIVIPKRLHVKNDMGLSRKEINQLKKGDTVLHKNNRNENVLIQLDPITNSLSSVKQTQITPPDTILGQKLTDQEKIKIMMGQQVELKNSLNVKINLLRNNGLEYKDPKGNEITYDDAKRVVNQKTEFSESTKKHQMKI